MAFFRKIVVDNREFEWKFTVDNYDWQMPSHIVFRSFDKALKIILYFTQDEEDDNRCNIGKCPFYQGVKAIKDEQPVIINLNQPRFIAELLHYLLEVRIESPTKGILYFSDGTKILHALGYKFKYRLGMMYQESK